MGDWYLAQDPLLVEAELFLPVLSVYPPFHLSAVLKEQGRTHFSAHEQRKTSASDTLLNGWIFTQFDKTTGLYWLQLQISFLFFTLSLVWEKELFNTHFYLHTLLKVSISCDAHKTPCDWTAAMLRPCYSWLLVLSHHFLHSFKLCGSIYIFLPFISRLPKQRSWSFRCCQLLHIDTLWEHSHSTFTACIKVANCKQVSTSPPPKSTVPLKCFNLPNLE